MSALAVTVAIRSYLGASRLRRTLDSIAGTEVPGGFEVLVVDDGSNDGTADVARRFSSRLPLRVVRHAENRGRAAAANTAFRQAAGRVVLVLDDDMAAGPDLVAKHLSAHASQSGIAALGRIIHDGLDPGRAFHAFLIREDEWRRRSLLAAGPIGFGQIWTGQLSVARADALAAGLFDETMRGYGLEDIEFAYRLSGRGVRFIYLDDAVSRHAGFMDDLDRYCARHASVGEMAAHLLRRHNTPEMRRYLRLEAAPTEGERLSVFVRLMNLSAAVLRRPVAAQLLAAPLAHRVLRGGVSVLEAARFRRTLSFAYSLLRDIQYFNSMGRALASDGEREASCGAAEGRR